MAKTKKMAFGGMGNAAMSSRGGIPAPVRNRIRNAPITPTQPVMVRPTPPIAEKPTVIQPGPMPVFPRTPQTPIDPFNPSGKINPTTPNDFFVTYQGNDANSERQQNITPAMTGGPGAPNPANFPSTYGPSKLFKKGGKVCYAGGGKAEEKKEAPIPAETLASMRRQAAQEKADRKQAEEQKAGEKEVRENMGRLGFKKGGAIKASKMGAVKVAKPTMRSASSRADGIAIRGKTRA